MSPASSGSSDTALRDTLPFPTRTAEVGSTVSLMTPSPHQEIPRVWNRLTVLRKRRQDLIWLVGFGILLAAITTAVVVAFYANNPGVQTDPDTSGYLTSAQHILQHGQLVDSARTPGFPLLIAAVYTVAGNANLGAVSVVQGILFVLATLELYALAYVLLKRSWIAFVVGLLMGTNIQMLSWVKPVIVEGTALWITVTTALVFVLVLRDVRRRTLWLFAVCMLALFMTRPEWIYAPVLLFGYLLFVAWRRGQGRRMLPHVLAAVVVLYAVLGLYVHQNATQNGYNGVTYVQNINLLGKVVQYRLSSDTDPRYRDINQAVVAYEASGGTDVFELLSKHQDWCDHYCAGIGAYSTEVLKQHPVQFVAATLPIMLASSDVYWKYVQVNPIARFGQTLTRLDTITSYTYLAYRYVPLFAVVWAFLLVWKRTSRRRIVDMMCGVVLMAMFELGITTAGAPSVLWTVGWVEYARIHMPVYPLFLLLIWGSLAYGVVWGLRAWWNRTSAPVQSDPAVQGIPQAET